MSRKKTTTKEDIDVDDIIKEFENIGKNLKKVAKQVLKSDEVKKVGKHIECGLDVLVKGINVVVKEVREQDIKTKVKKDLYKSLQRANKTLEKKVKKPARKKPVRRK